VIWILVAVVWALGVVPVGALVLKRGLGPLGGSAELGEATLLGLMWPVFTVMGLLYWAVMRVAAAIAWVASR